MTNQAPTVTTVELQQPELDLFSISDIHIDSVYCNRNQLFKDLDMAVNRGARITIFGDIFDAMNGRFDPRRSMDELRPEYRTSKYYDAIVEDAVDLLAPYAPNILMITPGNHELSVLKNANTFITDRLVGSLNEKYQTGILHGGYGGWLRIMLKPDENHSSTFLIKYFHGAGGDAPVTRGVIHTNRQAVYLPDADVVINGHNHNAYYVPITRERVSARGFHYFDTQHHVRTPGYVQSWADGSTGWEVTRGGVPKPMGGFIVGMRHSHAAAQERPPIIITSCISNPVPTNPVQGVYEGPTFPDE